VVCRERLAATALPEAPQRQPRTGFGPRRIRHPLPIMFPFPEFREVTKPRRTAHLATTLLARGPLCAGDKELKRSPRRNVSPLSVPRRCRNLRAGFDRGRLAPFGEVGGSPGRSRQEPSEATVGVGKRLTAPKPEGTMTRAKRIAALVVAGALALAGLGGAAHAWAPEGQKGYEGQPGNQGGFHQAGQQGYEGQPGNQGG
jgi:hypothetical protein